jgi:homotetrameric cytidine deaminase
MSFDLEAIGERLAREAWDVRKNSWAPYSRFRVGAALYLPDQDAVVTGVNVENASFGATICAERSAVLAAVSRYGKQTIAMLAVATDAEKPAVPCAQCLQLLAEFCAPTMPILLTNAAGIQERLVFSDLLPRPFTSF